MAECSVLVWHMTYLKFSTFDQVTVNVSGEQLENNFVNPAYRGDHSVGIVNTSSASTKPVQVQYSARLLWSPCNTTEGQLQQLHVTTPHRL